MDNPWGWMTASFLIYENQILEFLVGEMPAEAKFLRVVFSWAEPNLDAAGSGQVADIWLEVVRYNSLGGACPGTGTPLIIHFDRSFDTDKLVTVRGSHVSNKCIAIRIIAMEMPPDGGGDLVRHAHLAYYWEDTARDAGEDLQDIE